MTCSGSQLFQVLEGWLPPLEEEVPRELEEDSEGDPFDSDEEEEEVAPPASVARKTRMQKQREVEASRSLDEFEGGDEVA